MMRRRGLAAATAVLLSIAGTAWAEDRQPRSPPPPPPDQEQPPPGYGQPPPGYGQSPPGYYYAPDAKAMDDWVRQWKKGEPVPPGYHAETKIRKGLVISGAIVFGIVYLFTAIGGGDAVSKGSSGYAALFVPCAGPFLTLATTDQDNLETLALVFDGLVQIAGVALLVPGLTVPKTVLVRDDVRKSFVMPTPMTFGPRSAGLGLVGSF